jgi:hypothetical protein
MGLGWRAVFIVDERQLLVVLSERVFASPGFPQFPRFHRTYYLVLLLGEELLEYIR